MSLRSLLESTATLKRYRTPTKDSLHGTRHGMATTLWSDRPCSCQEVTAENREFYAQRNTVVSTIIYFDENPGALMDDIFEVADMYGETATYQVTGTYQTVGRGVLWQVPCVSVRPAV